MRGIFLIAREGVTSTETRFAVEGAYIVVFKESATKEQIEEYIARIKAEGGKIKYHYDTLMKGIAATMPNSLVQSFRQDDVVDFIGQYTSFDTLLISAPALPSSSPQELVGFEDDVVEYAMGLLEDQFQPTGPELMPINLTGFLESKTPAFMTALWLFCSMLKTRRWAYLLRSFKKRRKSSGSSAKPASVH
ncbi:hypothetical protein FRC07_010415 [Ceratobasidium sp. 392]|nr:hypothetical protein FRC07_010415 [Ceratobasidium sp. 392]